MLNFLLTGFSCSLLLSLIFSPITAFSQEVQAIKHKIRTGEVILSEIAKYDRMKLMIANLEGVKELDYCAVITVKIDKGRSIGVYDYVLIDNLNNTYPCVAIRVNDGVFDGNITDAKSDGKQRYSMFFFVNQPSGIANPMFKLKYKIFDNQKDENDIEFKNIMEQDFTLPSKIIEQVLPLPVPPPVSVPPLELPKDQVQAPQ